MKSKVVRYICLAMTVWMAVQPLVAVGEDIDLFIGGAAGSSGSAGNANVLLVFDNTSNWSRNNQHFVGISSVGSMEAGVAATVITSLTDNNINVGVMEYVTKSGSYNFGGFVRSAIKPMNEGTNKADLVASLNAMAGNVNDPDEKLNSNIPYGGMMFDIHNYLSGNTAWASAAAIPTSTIAHADDAAYTSTAHTRFQSPLSCGTSCAKTFVILVSNPDSNGPSGDTAANTSSLIAAGGNSNQLALPNLGATTSMSSIALGNTTSCVPTTTATSTCPTNGALYATTGGVSASASTTHTASCNASVNTYAPALTASCSDSSAYPFGCSFGAVSTAGVCASGTKYYTVTTDTITAASGCQKPIGSGGGYTCPTGNTCTASTTRSCAATSHPTYIDYDIHTKTTAMSSSCYASKSACTTAQGAGKTCDDPESSGLTCPAGSSIYAVNGNYPKSVLAPTGTTTADTNPWNADEWARLLYQKGISFGSSCSNQKVTTYTLDVTNNPPNKGYTPLLMNMAKVGGGKYFMASSAADIAASMSKIFQEIQAVNSTFASASLPVSATNRSQDQNQVYIGMFRPDPDAKPRWFGNLKRYEFAFEANGIDVHMVGKDHITDAINNNTGFIDDCATSYWTTSSKVKAGATTADDLYYWSQYPINPTPASNCSTVVNTPAAFSDSPDGPDVGKGAVAEVLRSGNSSSGTVTWAKNRTIYTIASGALTAAVPSSGLDANQQAWLSGSDNYTGAASTDTEMLLGGATTLPAPADATRASIHGDVIHSRPIPVTYSASNLVIYYGANDGNFRAVDSFTGKELWSLIPPEFATSSFVNRLRNNDTAVPYPSTYPGSSNAKPYGWDGSSGLYQNADNSSVWLYPTQRRGGRFVYGLDVTTATTPSLLFRVGCDPTGATCTTGFSSMGQSWSTPNVAPVANYTTNPVAFFGGGYDTCEDEDTSSPHCSTTKGNRVYAVDARNGTKLAEWSTIRAVPADIALIDTDGDGKADYGYAVDTGGNLYRMTLKGTSSSNWSMRLIASTTSGSGRKFQFTPTLSRTGNKVYVAMGSGDRERALISNYPYVSPVANRFYVFIDDLTETSGTYNLDNPSLNMTTDVGCSGTVSTDVLSKGWFIDLNQCGPNSGRGEQTVTSALLAGGAVAFSTNCPIPAAAGTCSTSLGEARGYWINLKTASGAVSVEGTCGGDRSGPFVGGGLPPSPVMGTVLIDGRPVTVILGAAQKDGGVNTTIGVQKIKPAISPVRKRIYWKQDGVD
jgi:Tfp pilus tip-associated adhesin PilY1